jgi:predicted DNA-binding transcriptional regulator YafY
MRGRNFIKLLKTLDLLASPQGITIDEMAEKLETDRRSVYRIMNIVEQLGFPVYEERVLFDRRKRWRLLESYLKKLPNMSVPDINLTLSEIIALHMLKGQAGIFKGTEIEAYILRAFEKLGMFVPKETFGKIDKIKALFISLSKKAKDYAGKEKIIELVTQAMLEKKTCRIQYHSFSGNKIKNFSIDPLHFFEHQGGLYLFVNATAYGHIRILAVERIKEVTPTPATFEYPSNFDPTENLESAFDITLEKPIQVKIWFSADQARYIKERMWSKTQRIEDQDDGSIILSMKTSGCRDIKKWVLSYGAEAMVLDPDSLRREIHDEWRAVERKYAA